MNEARLQLGVHYAAQEIKENKKADVPESSYRSVPRPIYENKQKNKIDKYNPKIGPRGGNKSVPGPWEIDFRPGGIDVTLKLTVELDPLTRLARQPVEHDPLNLTRGTYPAEQQSTPSIGSSRSISNILEGAMC